MSQRVVIYTKLNCPHCHRAKALFDQIDTAYHEISVDQDPAALEDMISLSGGKKTVPQILIDNRSIGGFDELWKLQQSGELSELLEE